MSIFREKRFQNYLLRRDQVNLLVYGPDRPYFKQKQEDNITKFSPIDIFKIDYLLLLDKKIRNKTQQTYK